MASSATPHRRMGLGGHYADPASPIASTPNRKAPVPARSMAPPTPSLASLSPMRVSEKPLQRHEDEGKSSTWGGIFSPVLKFFSSDEEAAAAAAGGAAAMPTRSSPAAGSVPATAVPMLGTAPGARGASGSAGVAASSSSSAAAGSKAPASPASAIAARAATSLTLSSPSSAAGSSSSAAASAAAAAPAVRPIAPEEEMSTAYCNNPDVAKSAAAAEAAAAGGGGEAEYEYEEFNPYLFIKMLPAYGTVAPRMPRIVLPRKALRSPPVSLVLDLDETLVHCSVDPIPDADVTFPVAFNGVSYQVYVRKRPYLDRFLQWIAGKFEVTIFTASQQVYAEKLLNLLDPEGRYINHRLYRDSCLNVDGNYLKDLNVLGRDLTKTVLVDNSPHAFGYQLDNGIPIESWFDDRGDTELLKLVRFLETIQHTGDVRPLVREKFKLHKLVSDATVPRGFY